MRIRITRSIIPNLLTLGNLFSGFSAIIYISRNEFEIAAIMILIAGIFDTLDGVVARLIRSTSAIGVELDSLCDVVSFGVAPSFMIYQMYFYQFEQIGIVISSLPALAGVYRLARFNVQATLEDKTFFKGMPVPSAALLIVSYCVFHFDYSAENDDLKVATLLAVTLVASVSMISTIKFDNLPRPNWDYIKLYPFKFIITLVAIIISIITHGKFIFFFMVFYVLYSYLRFVVQYFKKIQKKHITK